MGERVVGDEEVMGGEVGYEGESCLLDLFQGLCVFWVGGVVRVGVGVLECLKEEIDLASRENIFLESVVCEVGEG